MCRRYVGSPHFYVCLSNWNEIVINLNLVFKLDPWQDLPDDYGKDGFTRITSFKQRNPHLKGTLNVIFRPQHYFKLFSSILVTLAIGGWNEGSANYSKLASDPERRATFVKQSLDFIRKHNFDGLDLDWEYPGESF